MQGRSSNKRAVFVGGCILLGFVATGLSQAGVHLWRRDRIMDLAHERGRYELTQTFNAERGTIYSADGRALAQSQDVFEFGLFYDRLPRSPGFFADLSFASGISVHDLRSASLTGKPSRIWTTPISGKQAEQVRKVVKTWRGDGVSLRRILRRSYPLGEFGSGIIGLVRNGEAINGLERSLNPELRGTDGESKGYVDRFGQFVPLKADKNQPLINGEDVTLTIDSDLQFEAGRLVRQAVERHQAAHGAAVVIEPATGNILALANWPSFDPEGRIAPGSDLNVAYRGLFEPGSTFKIMTLAKAIELQEVGVNDHLNCLGKLQITRSRSVSCSHGAHGDIDWEKAIAESCNVAAAMWAAKIGTTEMHHFIRELGLLDKPDLGLPWETGGRYNENDPAKALQLANNGFGQAMNATPVALASAFSCLGNNGIRMTPRLIDRVGDRKMPAAEGTRVLSPETAEFVRGLMVSTIEKEYGTGSGLRVPGYRLAGKTGTAQKLQGGRMAGYVSSFVGFVPAEQPRAVVLVMIDDPKGGSYYGGLVAGPVYAELAKTIIRRYAIPPADSSPLAPAGPTTPAALGNALGER